MPQNPHPYLPAPVRPLCMSPISPGAFRDCSRLPRRPNTAATSTPCPPSTSTPRTHLGTFPIWYHPKYPTPDVTPPPGTRPVRTRYPPRHCSLSTSTLHFCHHHPTPSPPRCTTPTQLPASTTTSFLANAAYPPSTCLCLLPPASPPGAPSPSRKDNTPPLPHASLKPPLHPSAPHAY